MSNYVTLSYTITPTGPTPAQVQASMSPANVPLPLATLLQMGVYPVSDLFTAPTTRTVIIALGPSTPGMASCQLTPENTVTEVTIVDPGLNYVLPPVVSFAGGGPGGADLQANLLSGHSYPKARAYLNVQALTVTAVGGSYGPDTIIALVGGLPPALFANPQAGTNKFAERLASPAPSPSPNGPPYAINSLSLLRQGRGYSASTYVQIQGVLQPGGRAAQAVITGFGPNGQILGLLLIDPGAGYISPPEINFFDPVNGTQIASAGTQAKAIPLMGAGVVGTASLSFSGGQISGVTILTNGTGYVQPPTVVIYDPSGLGSGGVITTSLGLSNIVVDYPGLGMTTNPTVVLTPYFKAVFPDSSNQATPFENFPLFWALQKATASQVVPAAPVLT
jgi:hypothetical protein